MADYNDLTYFRLVGLFNGIIGDTTGQFGDPGPSPDIYNVNMLATISLEVTDATTGKPIAAPPELLLTTAVPPRTLLLLPIDADVESGVLRLPGADTGQDGVDIVAASPILNIPAGAKLICTVTFGTATIGGHAYNFDPVTFVVPTVLPADYHANVVQTLTIQGTPAGGNWTAVYGTTPTGALPLNTTAGQLQTALRAIAAIGNAVTVTGGTGGVNCVQTVTRTGTAGNFTLQVLSQTTGPIPNSAATTALQVQTALEALGYVGAGNVAVAGPAGGPFVCTFQNAMGFGVLDPMIAYPDSAMAAAGGGVSVAVTTPGANPGPYVATFDTAAIPRPLRLGTLDNLIGGHSPSVVVTDSFVPTIIDLTTVPRYVAP